MGVVWQVWCVYTVYADVRYNVCINATPVSRVSSACCGSCGVLVFSFYTVYVYTQGGKGSKHLNATVNV